jgi:lipopolysaccharide transport system permease protein
LNDNLFKNLSNLYKFKDLLYNLTISEVRIRYKQSFLGIGWAILQPLSLMLIFNVIFIIFARMKTEIPYPLFAYTTLFVWTFFSSAVNRASGSIVRNRDLVTKIYFPREIIPLASILARLVDFCFALMVFIGMAIFYKMNYPQLMPVTPWLLFDLVIVILFVLFAYALGLLGSFLHVYYRDTLFAVALVLQLWLYGSPILYPLTKVPDRHLWWYMLNPVSGLMEAHRDVIFYGQGPNWGHFAYSSIFILLVFVASFRFFKKVELDIADII